MSFRRRIPPTIVLKGGSDVTIQHGPVKPHLHKAGPGRPRHIAVLQSTPESDGDSKMRLMTKFYAVCDTLTYAEKKALAYALNRHYNTVDNWQKRKTFPPDSDTATKVIEWAEAGKLMGLEYQDSTSWPYRYERHKRAIRRAKAQQDAEREAVESFSNRNNGVALGSMPGLQ